MIYFLEFLSKILDLIISLTPVLIGLFLGVIVGTYRDKNKVIFEKKLVIYSQLISKLSQHTYILDQISINDLIEILAPGRLVCEKPLEDKLREYYSCISEYKNLNDSTKIKEMANRISGEVLEIEQLMREELGSDRVYSQKRIKNHLSKNQNS